MTFVLIAVAIIQTVAVGLFTAFMRSQNEWNRLQMNINDAQERRLRLLEASPGEGEEPR